MIFLGDAELTTLVSWQSRKVRRVVRSTLAAETLALIEAAEAAILLSHTMKEINGFAPAIMCFTDNASLVESLASTKAVLDKRLRIDIAMLREMIDRGEIKLRWIPTDHQLANCLTKRDANREKLLDILSANLKQTEFVNSPYSSGAFSLR